MVSFYFVPRQDENGIFFQGSDSVTQCIFDDSTNEVNIKNSYNEGRGNIELDDVGRYIHCDLYSVEFCTQSTFISN